VILLGFKIPGAARIVHDTTAREKFLNMDFPATVLIIGASTALILALEYGGVSYPWNSSMVIGLFVGFGLLTTALILLERWQGEYAMLTPRLIRKRAVWINSIWGFFFAGANFVILYYLPLYFQSVGDASPIRSGIQIIPLIASFSVATLFSGLLATKPGIAAPFLMLSSIISTIGTGLLYTLDIGTPSSQWISFQILAGLGFGLGLQVPIIIAQASSAASDLAPTTAIVICELPLEQLLDRTCQISPLHYLFFGLTVALVSM
jgi:hypothetical protein